MINIGVDYGIRRIAVACFEENWATSSESPKYSDRGQELRYLVEEYLSWTPVAIGETHLWIESAIMGVSMNVRTTVGMASTQGAIMASHYGPVDVVSVTAWKHGLTGHGNASKTDAWLWLAENYVDQVAVCGNQDEIDAMCLSLYGRMLVDGQIDPPVPRKPKKKAKAP